MKIGSITAVALLVLVSLAHGEERSRHALGEFEWLPTSSGVLIAAPHGTFDANTAPIVVEAARQAHSSGARRNRRPSARATSTRPTARRRRGCGSVRELPELALLIEPVDRITYTAACAKKLGALTADFAPRVLHFEFPRSAREGEAIKGAAMLVADIVRRLL